MDTEVLKFWSQFGAMGLCTGIVLWIYARQMGKHEENWKEIAQEWRKMTDDILLVIKENTSAFSQAMMAIREMQAQMNRWDGQERRSARRSGGG